MAPELRNPAKVDRTVAAAPKTNGAQKPMAQEPTPMRRTVVALALFSALSAIAGGAELILFPQGNAYMPPPDLLVHTPFTDFTIPGLILLLGVGGTSAACGWLTFRRSAWATDATLLAGGTLSTWIVAEFAMLREFHWLHALYFAVGFSLLVSGLRGARASSSPRHRYQVNVTAAEAIGFSAPVTVGVCLQQLSAAPATLALALILAGFFEGAALGFGQATGLPMAVSRKRFTWLTAAAATLTWSVALLAVWVVHLPMPAAIQALAGLLAATFGLGAMGGAQWLELRRHVPQGHSWILWTALAWLVAVPFSFVPGLFVDESTPAIWQLLLWNSGGIIMAYTMALITWQGARRLDHRRSAG